MEREKLPQLVVGCGYLGQRVAANWRSQGREVLAVTRSTERAEKFHQSGLMPIVADICDPDSLSDLPNFDCVLFAVGYDRSSGRTQTEVFVEGLTNVLRQVGQKCQRFLSISSTSVYGQSDGSWVDEESLCEPTQPGGVCCLAAEARVRELLPEKSVILRLAGIYGPGRLLSKVADLQARKPLPGRAEAWLNLIHVDDAASAVLTAAADDSSAGKTFLVVDSQPIRRGDYYSQLAVLVGAPPPKFDDALSRSRGSGGLNKRCSQRRLIEELGVVLKYPTIATGLPAALKDIIREGSPE